MRTAREKKKTQISVKNILKKLKMELYLYIHVNTVQYLGD